MHARFEVVEHTETQLVYRVETGLWRYGLMITFFGVFGIFTFLGFSSNRFEGQWQIIGGAYATGLFLIWGLGMLFYRCGLILNKESRIMVQWSNWFGFIRKTVHEWNEIEQFTVGSCNIATSEVTSATEYPIFFRVGVRRHRLLWPWTCRTRQQALTFASELASFTQKTTTDSSIKAVWSTPQEEHPIGG